MPPLACLPAPTTLLEPQPGAATEGNRSEAEGLEQQHPGPSEPPLPPMWFLPQSRGGENKTGPGLLEAANKRREHTCVQTHTRHCATPPAPQQRQQGGEFIQRVSGVSFITAAAEPPLCDLRCRFQGASRARSLVEKGLSKVGHFILAKKTLRLF